MKQIAFGLWENDRPDIKCDEGCGFSMKYTYIKEDGSDMCLCRDHGFQILKYSAKQSFARTRNAPQGISLYNNRYHTQSEMVVDNKERNGMTGKQIGLVVSLPKGVKEQNFAD